MWYNVMDQYAVFALFDNSRLILPVEKTLLGEKLLIEK